MELNFDIEGAPPSKLAVDKERARRKLWQAATARALFIGGFLIIGLAIYFMAGFQASLNDTQHPTDFALRNYYFMCIGISFLYGALGALILFKCEKYRPIRSKEGRRLADILDNAPPIALLNYIKQVVEQNRSICLAELDAIEMYADSHQQQLQETEQESCYNTIQHLVQAKEAKAAEDARKRQAYGVAWK